MNIKTLTSKTTLAACAVAVCALAAGIAAAQTGTPAAAPASSSSASQATKPHMHHDGQAVGPHGPHAPTFEELDTNHDGMVSKAEFDTWRAAHPMPGHPGDGKGDEGKGDWHGHEGWGGGFGMHRRMMWMRMHEMEMHHHGGFGHHLDFDAADTDHDGKISWAEFQAAADKHLKERFDKLDKNHDGFIEKDEVHGHGDHEGDHHWHHDGKDGKPAADAAAPAPAK